MIRQTSLIRTALLATCVSAVAVSAFAASHREAPGITQTPKVDATDFYMFRSYEAGREGYVTFIANYLPLQHPYGGPNYFTLDNDAIYEIHIDNDGDAIEDITFQFDFASALAGNGQHITLDIGEEGATETVAIPLRMAGGITAGNAGNLGETETYTLDVIRGDRRSGTAEAVTHGAGDTFTKPVDYIGSKTLPDYDSYAEQFIYSVSIPGCTEDGKVFVGQRADGFSVNLGPVFDLVNLVPIDGGSFPGGITQSRANDDVNGVSNVTSIALEVPISCLTDDDPVIGAWTTASLPQGSLEDPSPAYNGTEKFGGAWVQQSRLSAPLVNEVVIGLPDKDLFNAAEPTQDGALATYVTHPTFPALLDILFRDAVGATDNIAPSNFPRQDLVTAFLTGFPGLNQPANVTASEMMRLNTAIPATPRDDQSTFGVVAEDLAGFPNGRRPGDDVVDIALRVVMGALCHPLPLGAELGVDGAVEDEASDNINLGLCAPEDAPVGTAAFTDGAPLDATEFQDEFPYLNTPLAGDAG